MFVGLNLGGDGNNTPYKLTIDKYLGPGYCPSGKTNIACGILMKFPVW